jgi:hypothetical protein
MLRTKVAQSQAILAVVASALLAAGTASAHHSFAAFFDVSRVATIKGKVTQFRFTNPHGIIALDVIGGTGTVQQWLVETNAPSLLARRGWSRTSIKFGEIVIIEGWPAREKRPYMRLRKAMRADGTVIGIPFGQGTS